MMESLDIDESVNVFGEVLSPCSENPLTGFMRDGCCNTSDSDRGSHTVCVRMTQDFLEYSLTRGNDLITARHEFEFPGLKPGDKWCLCAARWLEAHKAGVAPKLYLKSTHQKATEVIDLSIMKPYALDLN
jgi:uncharacterized protein (DUF2237 family)